jgi:phosphatidylglycerophosphate synthase
MLGVVLAIPALSVPGKVPDAGLSAPVEPSTKLGGLSLALRAVLGLQKEGVQKVVLAIRSGDRPLLEQIRRDSRVAVAIDAVEVAPGESPLTALGPAVDEPFLLCSHDLVLDPEVLRKLRDAPAPARLGWAAARAGAPLCALPPLRAEPALLHEHAPSIEQLIAQGEIDLREVGQAWAADVRSAEGRKQAVFHLFDACRKPVDGLVARYLNRHVSLFLSKRLVNTPVSPNAMTIVTFLVGLSGAIVAVRGGYLPTLLGAALMQCNSILDGVDGELARVRFQHSKLGQWLDTIGDDSTNFFFYVGLALGARSLRWGATWMSAAGWLVAGTTVLAAALYYTELLGVGSGDLNALEWSFEKQPTRGWKGKVLRWGHYLLKQDCFIFLFLVFAVCGVLHYALPLFATGGVVTVLAAAGRRLVRWRASKAAQISERDSKTGNGRRPPQK